MNPRYHHGDLPAALRCAAVDVIVEKGLANFSLREVARRAGVSHAAPAHHFGDTTGLLTSIAIEALTKLATVTREAASAHDDPVERLSAIGRAYVRMGQEYPAHCEVAFRSDLVDHSSEAYATAGADAFGVLVETIEALARELNPQLAVLDAANLCWSAMQGLLVLHETMLHKTERAGGEATDIEETATRFTRLLVDGFRTR
ncbi:MAG TPA: TetR/AcrR family transcriptional regulator [Acidimicrobiia bacterium]|nr:TetR/AcrR family transcriptional regulator [Acidimicrobiia bacterium]